MSKVFLDMDGVLVDFLRGVNEFNKKNESLDWSKMNYKEIGENKRVIDCMNTPGFFLGLPMMKGALILWRAAGPNRHVLTAWPSTASNVSRVASEKRDWIEITFGKIDPGTFICCAKEEKQRYATFHTRWIEEPNILVDDHSTNIKQWEAAGGIGILFKNMDQAVNDLRKALKIVNG